MSKISTPIILLFVSMLALVMILFLWQQLEKHNKHKPYEAEPCVDLTHILERQRLDVGLEFNSLNYYILHGRAYGFQYELARYFANHLEIELRINIVNDLMESIEDLKSGSFDILCQDLTNIKDRFGKSVTFTEPYAFVKQVLIQNKNNKLIRDFSELDGETIYIPRGTIFKQIINSNPENKQYDINIIEVPLINNDFLIDAVADGKIKLTISDFHIANYHYKIYKNLDISFEISDNLPLSWCMRTCSSKLIDTFNLWLNDFRSTREFKYLYNRYFQRQRIQDKYFGEYFSIKGGKISDYDKIVQKYSSEFGWDWRLVSSLIYEESRFKHHLESPSGAYGIMQLMPITAERHGVYRDSPVEDHIRAGIKLLKNIENRFIDKVPDSTQRIKFVLASYNLGEGHVLDAIELTKKYRKNPELWEENVELFLIRKANKLYFNDEVVKYGFCKGKTASIFVKNILNRYEHYKNAFPVDK